MWIQFKTKRHTKKRRKSKSKRVSGGGGVNETRELLGGRAVKSCGKEHMASLASEASTLLYASGGISFSKTTQPFSFSLRAASSFSSKVFDRGRLSRVRSIAAMADLI